jgi:hypothetical protein
MPKRRPAVPDPKIKTVNHTGVQVVSADADSVSVVDNRQTPGVAIIIDDVINHDLLPSPRQQAAIVDWYQTHVGSIRRHR